MISGSGFFISIKDSTNYIKNTSDGFDIRSANFDLLTSTQHISSSNGGVIAMGGADTANLYIKILNLM